MTIPPGTVNPRHSLPSRIGQSPIRPARCLPSPRAVTVRWLSGLVNVVAVARFGGMDRKVLARRIHQAAHLTGEFTLRSGAVSNEYFDKYRFEADPALLLDICEFMAELVPNDIDALAGLELGGVPIATMVSSLTGRPALFVRKKAKEYGTCKLAEGPDVVGRRVTLVEDVITTGGAVRDATNALREAGAIVEVVVCAIDRSPAGENPLADVGLEVRPVLTKAQLDAVRG